MPSFAGVDYFLIDSLLTEQELLVRQTARQFVEDRVIPQVRDCFRDARFPRELIPEWDGWDSWERIWKATAAPA
jgi:glutaryl-CoA dehydrogenase